MTTYYYKGDAHQVHNLDSTLVQWPACNDVTAMPAPNGGVILPKLQYIPGDVILVNNGQDYTYTSSDGTVTIQFGSILSGVLFTNAAPVSGTFTVGGVTHYYSGPHCSMDPTAIDLTDEMFHDVEALYWTDYIDGITLTSPESPGTPTPPSDAQVQKVIVSLPDNVMFTNGAFAVTTVGGFPQLSARGLGSYQMLMTTSYSSGVANQNIYPISYMGGTPVGIAGGSDPGFSFSGAIVMMNPAPTIDSPTTTSTTAVTAGTTVLVTTSAAHGLLPGQYAAMDVGSANAETVLIITTPLTTTFTAFFSKVHTGTWAQSNLPAHSRSTNYQLLPSQTDLSNPGNATYNWIPLGRFSTEKDPMTGQYKFNSNYAGTDQTGSDQLPPKVIGRAPLDYSIPTSYMFVGGVFVTGMNGIYPTLTLKPISTGQMLLVGNSSDGTLTRTFPLTPMGTSSQIEGGSAMAYSYSSSIVLMNPNPGIDSPTTTSTTAVTAGATVLVTTNAAHNIVVGQYIVVDSNAPNQETVLVLTTPLTTTFTATFAKAHSGTWEQSNLPAHARSTNYVTLAQGTSISDPQNFYYKWIKLGTWSLGPDAVTGNWIFHSDYPGSSQAEAANQGDGSITRPALTVTDPARVHVMDGYFAVTGGTAAPVLSCTSLPGGTARLDFDDGRASWTIPSLCVSGVGTGSVPWISSWPTVAAGGTAGAYVLINIPPNYPTGTPVFATVSNAEDLTLPKWTNYLKLGQMSVGTDQNGNYSFHSFMGNTTQAATGNVGDNAVGNNQLSPLSSAIHIYRNTIFSITASSGTTCTINWTAGLVLDESGAAIGNGINAGNVAANIFDLLVFNTSAAAGSNITRHNSGYLPNATTEFVIGLVNSVTDSMTGQYTFLTWNVGSSQVGGDHITPGGVGRKQTNRQDAGRGHFLNIVFKVTGGSSPVVTPTSIDGTSAAYFAPDDGSGNTSGLFVVPRTAISVALGGLLLYNTTWNGTTNTTGGGTTPFLAVAQGTNLTIATYDYYMRVGQMGGALDSKTGNAVFHSYFPGSDESAGANVAPNAIDTTHLKDGGVTTAKFPDGAVTTVKLLDGAVNTLKILGGAVVTTSLGDGAVTGVKVADAAIDLSLSGTGAKVANKLSAATRLANDATVIQNMVSYVDTAHVLATSAWEGNGIVYVQSTNWTAMTFRNAALQAPGALSGGNLTGFDAHGADWSVEVQVQGNDGQAGVRIGSTAYASGWKRLLVFTGGALPGKPAVVSNTTTTPAVGANLEIPVPEAFGYVTYDANGVFVVTRFEILNDGTVNCQYVYSWAGTLTQPPTTGIRFRVIQGQKP